MGAQDETRRKIMLETSNSREPLSRRVAVGPCAPSLGSAALAQEPRRFGDNIIGCRYDTNVLPLALQQLAHDLGLAFEDHVEEATRHALHDQLAAICHLEWEDVSLVHVGGVERGERNTTTSSLIE